MPEGSDALRTEIIESEKMRVDFLKWKLILIAALGAAGLGWSKDTTREPLILLLIPFVCLYVDILCYHNDLRILVIARFLRTSFGVSHFWQKYEAFCLEKRGLFSLEAAALRGSSVAVSTMIAVFGVLPMSADWTSMFGREVVPLALSCAGSFGVVLSFLYDRLHRDKLRALGENPGDCKMSVTLLIVSAAPLGTAIVQVLKPTVRHSDVATCVLFGVAWLSSAALVFRRSC